MRTGLDWLSDIVLVGEGDTIQAMADVDLFRSVGDACRYLEHWWVEESLGFAITAAGDQLILGVDQGTVVCVGREPLDDGAESVRRLLRKTAGFVLDARRHKAQKRKLILGEAEQLGELPLSIEGLVAYIGFSE